MNTWHPMYWLHPPEIVYFRTCPPPSDFPPPMAPIDARTITTR